MTYIPANLLEYSREYLLPSDLAAFSLGFPSSPLEYQAHSFIAGNGSAISIDYLSLTAFHGSCHLKNCSYEMKKKIKGIDDWQQLNDMGFRERMLSYLCSFFDDYYKFKKIDLLKLITDDNILKYSHNWEFKKGKNFYSNSLYHSISGITVNYSNNGEINGDTINIVVPGAALRLLSLSNQLQLLNSLIWYGFRASRIDYAYDYFGYQKVSDYFNECKRGNYFGIQKKSINYHQRLDDVGDTLYLGSRQSQKMMRIYDAGFKHCPELIRLMPDGFRWLRFEAELKSESAQKSIEILLKIYSEGSPSLHQQYVETAYQQLNLDDKGFDTHYGDGWLLDSQKWSNMFGFWQSILISIVDFRDRRQHTHIDRTSRLALWSAVVDSGPSLQLTIPNCDDSQNLPARALRWLRRQVSGTLVSLAGLAQAQGIDLQEIFAEIIDSWYLDKKISRIDRQIEKFLDFDFSLHDWLRAPSFPPRKGARSNNPTPVGNTGVEMTGFAVGFDFSYPYSWDINYRHPSYLIF